jgi:hypothetical protein
MGAGRCPTVQRKSTALQQHVGWVLEGSSLGWHEVLPTGTAQFWRQIFSSVRVGAGAFLFRQFLLRRLRLPVHKVPCSLAVRRKAVDRWK